MTEYNSGRLIAEKLNTTETGSFVAFCPFHPNTDTAALSVDLDKGVFYCFGGCREPKGGGVVDFLMKWARIVDKKPMTKAQARKLLHKSFVLPSAKELLAQHRKENLKVFAYYYPYFGAPVLRQIEEEIALITEMWLGWPVSPKIKWARLAELYSHRDIYEFALEECVASSKKHSDHLSLAYQTIKGLGLWDDSTALMAWQRRSRRLAHARRKSDAPILRTPVLPLKGEDQCRPLYQQKIQPKSRLKRQPVPSLSTPTTIQTKRTPIPPTILMSLSKRSPVK